MIDLVPAMSATARTQEFMAIAEEATAFHKLCQKASKTFSEEFKKLIETKLSKIAGKTLNFVIPLYNNLTLLKILQRF